jgi:hypothetical protein
MYANTSGSTRCSAAKYPPTEQKPLPREKIFSRGLKE